MLSALLANQRLETRDIILAGTCTLAKWLSLLFQAEETLLLRSSTSRLQTDQSQTGSEHHRAATVTQPLQHGCYLLVRDDVEGGKQRKEKQRWTFFCLYSFYEYMAVCQGESSSGSRSGVAHDPLGN